MKEKKPRRYHQYKYFHCGFEIHEWDDILPDIEEYLKDDEIIHINETDINNCRWKKQSPPAILTPDYIKREVKRILRTGVWFLNKGMPIWLPPAYYSFLQYFHAGGAPPEFRLSRMKSVYEKIRARNNPMALGTYTIKSRQIGETTLAMSDALVEAAYGNMDYGMIGIQSKSRETVIQSCWRTLIMGWNGYPKWLKKALYDDFRSGDRVATTMKFVKQASDVDAGRNVLIAFAANAENSFDSVNNMRQCILDEVNKWEKSFYKTFLNYEKFIATGTSRRGLFNIFSSPADTDTVSNEECYTFWMDSDPEKLNEQGTTSTRIFRIYANPLMGIEGFYDKWGDADPTPIYEHIMARRKAVPKEYKQSEIRAYPLTVEEMFGTFDSGNFWSNHSGVVQRKIELADIRVKDPETMEPRVLYGNLEWEDGIRDYGKIIFRQSDYEHFDLLDARFCISYLPDERFLYDLKDNFTPPHYVQTVLGIDSVDKRYPGRGPSDFAMVAHKFRDLENRGIVKCPTMIYCCRPLPIEIAYEDAIKAAIFTQAMVQVESLNTKIVDYFEDRGYIKWMLAKIGKPQNSLIKGDAPTGGGRGSAFMDEIAGLLDAILNVPRPGETFYPLKINWFIELLDDATKFNLKDTHARDLTMAWGQALLGVAKLLHQLGKTEMEVNEAVLNFMLN